MPSFLASIHLSGSAQTDPSRSIIAVAAYYQASEQCSLIWRGPPELPAPQDAVRVLVAALGDGELNMTRLLVSQSSKYIMCGLLFLGSLLVVLFPLKK